MKKILSVVLCTAMLISATGCSQVTDKLESAVDNAGSIAADAVNNAGSVAADAVGGSSSGADESSSLTDRYNSYVELYNLMANGSMSSAIDDYFESVADQEEFESTEDAYITYDLSEYDYEDLEKAYEYAQTESEYADVDAAVVALYPVMKDTMDILNEAASYGEMKGYLDDDFEKAKDIHSRLYPVINEYWTLGSDFFNKFDELAAKEAEKELTSLKEEGYEVRYNMAKIVDLAGKISDEFYVQDTIYTENINELDITDITPIYEELSQVITDFDALLKSSDIDKTLEDEGFDATFDKSSINRFKDAAVETKVSVTEIIERVKKNEAPSQSDLTVPDYASGTFEAFERCYSSLISSYNGAID